jgi:hypothetical protein
MLLRTGCSPKVTLGKFNHWVIQFHSNRDDINKYFSMKKGKALGVVFKDGSTDFSKLKCVDN